MQIHPDQSVYTLPPTQYYFYNTDGDAPIIIDGDEYGNFNGSLPVGTYHVIATNVAASRVTFATMDSHETAIVRLPELDSSLESPVASRAAEDYTLLPQPGNVYSTVIEELIVTINTTVRKDPSPILLTKRLNFAFTMEDGLASEITAMTGILPGIYPAVHLYTHQGVETEHAPAMATPFATTADGNTRKAQIFLFGLHDPAHGEHYTHTLELRLTMADGSTTTFNLNLTETLSDIIDQNQGTLPISISIPIRLTKTDIGVAADIGGWIQEGESELQT